MRRKASALWIFGTLILTLAGLWIAAPAAGGGLGQLDPTAQQATVDAALQTLFAQTAQPPDMTQTIAAAFGAAQTATAAAIPPAPVSADTLQVAEMVELPLLAAPARTSAYLAPDGERIAYLRGPVLCVLDIDTLDAYVRTVVAAGTDFENALDGLADAPDQFPGVACVSLETVNGLDQETIRWSPDGRYLVMTENFFVYFKDSDLWVVDTETMTLSDITDDEREDYPMFDSPPGDLPPVDVVPRWLADGRLLFLRYGSNQAAPALYTVQPDGSDLQQIGQIETPQRFAVYALAVSAHGKLAYNLFAGGDEYAALSGVWISGLDGSSPRQVWHNADQPNRVPLALEWSPDGQYIALNIPDASYGMKYEPANSFWQSVRVSDGQVEYFSPDQFVLSIGWSPVGSAVVYTTGGLPGSETLGLYIAAGPGAPARMLVPAGSDTGDPATALIVTTSKQNQAISWTANQTVMIGRGARPGILIIRLAAP